MKYGGLRRISLRCVDSAASKAETHAKFARNVFFYPRKEKFWGNRGNIKKKNRPRRGGNPVT